MAKVDHKPTQNERIISYINEFGSITQMEALRDLGVARLASRISDLKRLGYEFRSEFVPIKNRWEKIAPLKDTILQRSYANARFRLLQYGLYRRNETVPRQVF